MKKFAKHDEEVSDMVYFVDKKFLITCGWDGQLKIFDDNKTDREGQLMFNPKQDIDEVKKDNIKPLNCLDLYKSTYHEKNKITGKVESREQ